MYKFQYQTEFLWGQIVGYLSLWMGYFEVGDFMIFFITSGILYNEAFQNKVRKNKGVSSLACEPVFVNRM